MSLVWVVISENGRENWRVGEREVWRVRHRCLSSTHGCVERAVRCVVLGSERKAQGGIQIWEPSIDRWYLSSYMRLSGE